MKKVTVSASYWAKLSEKERKVFGELIQYGCDVTYAKRILTLTKKYFPAYDSITPSSVLNPDVPIYLTAGVLVIKDEGKILGSIYKGYGIGITERVNRYDNEKYVEIWHN